MAAWGRMRYLGGLDGSMAGIRDLVHALVAIGEVPSPRHPKYPKYGPSAK